MEGQDQEKIVPERVPGSLPVSDGKDNSDPKIAEADTLEERIALLSKKLKNVCRQVTFVAERNKRLEDNIDSIAETLKTSDANYMFEVDGKKLSIDDHVKTLKAGYLLSNLAESGNGSGGTNSNVTDTREQETEWSFDTNDLLKTESHEDKGLSVHQMMDYETQIETLKVEMETLRTAMAEAYGREQDYKKLVDQLDMAESRANQKWGAFHNNVVQQWSNHCDHLQHQLDSTAMRLREVSFAYQQRSTSDASGNTAAATPSTTDFEYAEDGTLYIDQPQPHHILSESQEQATAAFPINATTVTARPPMPPMPFPPAPHNAYIPAPPPPFPPALLSSSPPPMSGRMSSACQLHRFFSNLAMIEKAQLEGRAYPLSSRRNDQYQENVNVPDDDDDDDVDVTSSAASAHTPRRARAFGAVTTSNDQTPSTTFALKPNANPFVPDVQVRV